MNFFELIQVDKRQNTPLRIQLMNELRLAIFDYQLADQSMLPSISDMTDHLLMSLSDVKAALQALEQEGIIMLSKKNQYMVTHKKQSNEFMAKAFLLFQYIKKLGMEPSIETLVQKVIIADDLLAKKMSLSVGDKVMYLKRVYYGNRKPMVLLESYFSISLLPEVENITFTNQPHFEVLIKHYSFEPHRSVRESRVIALTKEQAKALNDMEGSPCHQVEVWTYEKGGKLTDYNRATLPSSDVFETVTTPSLIQSIF